MVEERRRLKELERMTGDLLNSGVYASKILEYVGRALDDNESAEDLQPATSLAADKKSARVSQKAPVKAKKKKGAGGGDESEGEGSQIGSESDDENNSLVTTSNASTSGSDGLPRSELEELESTAINSPSTGKKRKTSNLETDVAKRAKTKGASSSHDDAPVKGLKKVDRTPQKKLNSYVAGLNKTLNADIKDSSTVVKDEASSAEVGSGSPSGDVKKTAEKSTSKTKRTGMTAKNKRSVKMDDI